MLWQGRSGHSQKSIISHALNKATQLHHSASAFTRLQLLNVLCNYASSTLEKQRAQSEANHLMHSQIFAVLAAADSFVAGAAYPAEISAALHAQPACFPALEATLRRLDFMKADDVNDSVTDTLNACNVALDITAAIATPDAAAFESRIAGSYASQQQVQLQLFALCISSLKCAVALASLVPQGGLVPKSAMGVVTNVCNIACGMMAATQIASRPSRSSSSSSSSSRPILVMTAAAEEAKAAQQLWMVVLTRCLLLSGDALERVASWDSDRGSLRDAAASAHHAAVAANNSLEYIGPYADRNLSEAASPGLYADCAQMQNRLRALIWASVQCKASAACCPGAAAAAAAGLKDVQLLADVHQQAQWGLVRFIAGYAELILALLPLPHMCNNPDCVILQQRSELQLVAVKGSRCSGCKVAR
jgi:hypothetical protein